jgi:penicillin-binding protein 2
MANLAATIANKGWYYDPHFVQSPKKDFPIQIQKNQTMVDAKHFSPVIDGMWRVVNEAGGTAGLAKIDGIDVCGKTGTVENFIGSVKQKNHSVFIAFAPMDNPQIAIAVFVENAGFGGTWAAPIASLMIEKYLNKTISNPAKEKRILDAVLNNN